MRPSIKTPYSVTLRPTQKGQQESPAAKVVARGRWRAIPKRKGEKEAENRDSLNQLPDNFQRHLLAPLLVRRR
jgi:hypothetical protein